MLGWTQIPGHEQSVLLTLPYPHPPPPQAVGIP